MGNVFNPVIVEQLSEAERELILELSCSLRGIHYLPQYAQYEGYLSIGCQPCTALPFDPNNPRSDRWGGTKLECEIHTFIMREQT
jgi:3'-phosphoadenosine 5'-phosphosulfate sulfotransferase (PAPS reductase)/FAD synthetase